MELNDISNLDGTAKCCRATTGHACSARVTGCGIRTARSKKSRRSSRCSPPAESRPPVATPNSPICRRPDEFNEERRNEVQDLAAFTASSTRVASSVSTTSPRPNARSGHPFASGSSVGIQHRPVVALLSSHAGAIEGWPTRRPGLSADLNEHATQRWFVYAHVWQAWDLVMWDNRVTMHRARPFRSSEARDMRRTTLTDEVSEP